LTAAKKAVAMCCVSIGHQDYLLPADKGMKLVELLQSAFETEQRYVERGYIYYVGEQPAVALALVRAAQIKPARQDTNAAGQRLLGVDD
jgi:hypothetical protein